MFGIGTSQLGDLNTTLWAPSSPRSCLPPILKGGVVFQLWKKQKAVRGILGGAGAAEVVEAKVLAHGSA